MALRRGGGEHWVAHGMSKQTLVIQGQRLILHRLNKFLKGKRVNLKRAMYAGGVIVKNRSQQLAPVLTGALRGSHYATKAHRTNKHTYEVEVGATVYYAIIQHENLEFRHPRGGTAKFLELALLENRNKVQKMIVDALKV